MDGTHAAARAGARPAPYDDCSLLESLLAAHTAEAAPVYAAPAWAAAARLRAAPTRRRAAPASPTARKLSASPFAAAATLLLAGGIVAASVGVAPARAAMPVADPVAHAVALAPAVAPRAAAGALRALKLAPAGDEALLARLLAEPAAQPNDAALLAELLASEPTAGDGAVVAAAPPAAVSFATVAKLPAAAFNYKPAAQALPMITLADNIPLPPPAPPPAVVAQAQQPPAPPGYVPPPGYRDGQYLGGQYPGLAPGQFPSSVGRPAARPTTRPVAAGVYIVRAGDTLASIALRYYGDARYAAQIWDANYRLIGANPNAIFPGQRLTLPGLTVTVRPLTPLPARGAIPAPSRYTIQPRDFLRWMAQRAYGNEMLWPEIYHANRNVLGPNPDLIYPGVTVFIP